MYKVAIVPGADVPVITENIGVGADSAESGAEIIGAGVQVIADWCGYTAHQGVAAEALTRSVWRALKGRVGTQPGRFVAARRHAEIIIGAFFRLKHTTELGIAGVSRAILVISTNDGREEAPNDEVAARVCAGVFVIAGVGRVSAGARRRVTEVERARVRVIARESDGAALPRLCVTKVARTGVSIIARVGIKVAAPVDRAAGIRRAKVAIVALNRGVLAAREGVAEVLRAWIAIITQRALKYAARERITPVHAAGIIVIAKHLTVTAQVAHADVFGAGVAVRRTEDRVTIAALEVVGVEDGAGIFRARIVIGTRVDVNTRTSHLVAAVDGARVLVIAALHDKGARPRRGLAAVDCAGVTVITGGAAHVAPL